MTEGIDAQAAVNVTVENVDTDTIFNATGIDFGDFATAAITTSMPILWCKMKANWPDYLKKTKLECVK